MYQMQSVHKVMNRYYIGEEKQVIDGIFLEGLNRWEEELAPYHEAVRDDFTFVYLPLVVFKAYQFLGVDERLSATIASLFKTVYFGNTINQVLRDDDEGQVHNQEMQFSILIADYIFGRILKSMVDCGLSWLLDSFARMFAEISEGFILKHCYAADPDTVLEKTRLPLYATAFYSAGRVAGCDHESALAYSQIGRTLGMAMEFHAVHDRRSLDYLLAAGSMLKDLNIRNRNYEHDLSRLVDMMVEASMPDGRIAAV